MEAGRRGGKEVDVMWEHGRCKWWNGKDLHGGNVSKLLLLLRATVRNYYRRDRSGTAAGPQNVGIPTIPGCRRDRSRRRRDHFTCEFIGAGPHTPFGNYNNIPGGVRWCFGGGVWEDSWGGDVLEVGCGKILGEISCLSSVVSLDVF